MTPEEIQLQKFEEFKRLLNLPSEPTEDFNVSPMSSDEALGKIIPPVPQPPSIVGSLANKPPGLMMDTTQFQGKEPNIFELTSGALKNVPLKRAETPAPQKPPVEIPAEPELESAPPRQISTETPFNGLDFGENNIASQQGLKDAQNRQNDLQFLANMNRSFGQFAGGLSQTDYKGSPVADAVERQGKQQVENYEQQVAFQKQDPNSAYSKGLKDYFKNKLGMEIRGDASAVELEKIMPLAVREFEAAEARKEKGEERKYRASEKATDRKHDKDLLGMRLKGQTDKKEAPLSPKELTTQTRLIRADLRRGPAGKTYNNFLNSDRAFRTIEQFLQNPTGYSDYGTLLGGLKALQGDESVVREAEIRLGMDAGSFQDKILNRIEKLRTGKSLQKGQREDILSAVNVLRDVTKNQFLEIAEPDLVQAESMGIPRNHLLSSVFDEEKKSDKKDPKIQEYADAHFDGDYEKARTLLEKRGYGKQK